MLLIDDLLLGGLGFVLDKLATVVDQELNDESHLHRTLMEAQMRFEMGEIGAEEFAGIERTVIDRLREIRAAREGEAPSLTDEGVRIGSIEISGPDADVDVEMPAIGVDVDAAEPAAVMSPPGRGSAPARRANTTQAKTAQSNADAVRIETLARQTDATATRRPRRSNTKAAQSGRRQARR